MPISHFDLYRLGVASELDELGFDEALGEGAAVVEWPERAGGRLPPATVHVELLHEGEGRLARSCPAPARPSTASRARWQFAIFSIDGGLGRRRSASP